MRFKKKLNDEKALYALEHSQLVNLQYKNIHFLFFQLEDFPLFKDCGIKQLLQKAEKKEGRELLPLLKGKDLAQPIILICGKGRVSMKWANKLRDEGFINVYYVKDGLQGLLRADKT